MIDFQSGSLSKRKRFTGEEDENQEEAIVRLVALTVSGLLAGLGLAAAIVGGGAVARPRAALVAAHLTGAQEVS